MKRVSISKAIISIALVIILLLTPLMKNGKAKAGNVNHIGEYKVVFDYNGGSLGTVTQWYGAGVNMGIPSASRTGYKFDYWKCDDGNKYYGGAVIRVMHNMKLTAVWTPIQYSVAVIVDSKDRYTFKANHGTRIRKVISDNGLTPTLGYSFNFGSLNLDNKVTNAMTINVLQVPNTGRIILHDLGTGSGSPRTLQTTTGTLLSTLINEPKSSGRYLIGIRSNSYGSVGNESNIYAFEYAPAVVRTDITAEFTGVWITKGQSIVISYTFTKDDIYTLKKAIDKINTNNLTLAGVKSIIGSMISGAASEFVSWKIGGIKGKLAAAGVAAIIALATGIYTYVSASELASNVKNVKDFCNKALKTSKKTYTLKVNYYWPIDKSYSGDKTKDLQMTILPSSDI